jgi:hypothetical protein
MVEGQIYQERFSALVPIPKLECGAASCRPFWSWPLGRRSGRVATEPYPRPKPLAIVNSLGGINNWHEAVSQLDAVGRELPVGHSLLRRACDPGWK